MVEAGALRHDWEAYRITTMSAEDQLPGVPLGITRIVIGVAQGAARSIFFMQSSKPRLGRLLSLYCLHLSCSQ